MNTTEYIAGMQAAKKGAECPVGAHADFIRGYGVQYDADQVLDARSRRVEGEFIRVKPAA